VGTSHRRKLRWEVPGKFPGSSYREFTGKFPVGSFRALHTDRTFLRSAYSGFCWIPPVVRRLFEVTQSPHRGTSLGPLVCGAKKHCRSLGAFSFKSFVHIFRGNTQRGCSGPTGGAVLLGRFGEWRKPLGRSRSAVGTPPAVKSARVRGMEA
jgi:hypothetical protein